jgi:serine/threonine-protein kinase
MGEKSNQPVEGKVEDLSGKQLGPYLLVGPLGEGGMAVVYKAYHAIMERYVALKILPRHFAADPDFVRRFKQEARIIAGLEHPNILPVYDYGETDGYTYLVMRYVEGATLANWLRGQPLPLPQVSEVISKVAAALDYAHTRGVVHRDVKPSNVLIDQQGNPLLSDFGLAKVFLSSTKLTLSGAFLGTPTYASPEQCLGRRDLDGRSDVYSLGVMLYEMVTGRPPFDAETPMAIVFKHVNDSLPLPRSLNPTLPEAVERVILKALAKEPENRFSTAGQMAEALEAAITAAGKPASIAPPFAPVGPRTTLVKRSRIPAWIWTAGCLGMLVMLLVIAGLGIKLLPGLFKPDSSPTLAIRKTSVSSSTPRKLTPTSLVVAVTHLLLSLTPSPPATATRTPAPPTEESVPSVTRARPTLTPTSPLVVETPTAPLLTPLALTTAPPGLEENAPWPMINGGLKHWSRLPFAGPAHPEFTEASGFYQIGFWPGVAIAADGTRYTNAGGSHDTITAIGVDGLEKWSVTLEDPEVFLGWLRGAFTPAIDRSGTIYIGFPIYKLFAISPDGTVLWRFTTGDGVGTSAAIGTDGTVYFGGSDGVVYAVNADGTLKWKYSGLDMIYSSPALDDDGTIYIGGEDGNLYAFTPQGDLQWKFTSAGYIRSSPMITDQGVYFGAEDGTYYALAKDGSLRWKLSVGDRTYGSPALGLDGSLYVLSPEPALVAISQDGTILWTYSSSNIDTDLGGESDTEGATPRVDIYGTIYIPCGDPDICAIDPAGNFLGYYRPAEK